MRWNPVIKLRSSKLKKIVHSIPCSVLKSTALNQVEFME